MTVARLRAAGLARRCRRALAALGPPLSKARALTEADTARRIVRKIIGDSDIGGDALAAARRCAAELDAWHQMPHPYGGEGRAVLTEAAGAAKACQAALTRP